MRQPYQYLMPRPRWIIEYTWKDATGEIRVYRDYTVTQDTGSVTIHIPEQHARGLVAGPFLVLDTSCSLPLMRADCMNAT